MRSLRISSYAGCLIILLLVAFSAPVDVQQLSSPARQGQPRDLLYVTAGGSSYVPPHHLGLGILVFDVANEFKFVKRIPTWDVPVSQRPEIVSGIAASVATGYLYVATPSRLAAFDLTTDEKVWEQTYDGQCCEMIAASPDGTMLYLNSYYMSHMYAVDAKTGALIQRVENEVDRVERSHNVIWSPDGSKVFQGGSGATDFYISVADPRTHRIMSHVGPFSHPVRQFTTNAGGSLLYVTMRELCGVEIASVESGNILHRLECPGEWKNILAANPDFRVGHGTPSHGIGMTADEKELWIVDGITQQIYAYDATVNPPAFKASVKTRVQPYSMSISLDDKYVLSFSGDVIDTMTKKVVHVLKDEYGRDVYSEKFVQATFDSETGKMLRGYPAVLHRPSQ